MILKRDYFSILYKFLKNSNLKPLLGLLQKLAAKGEVYLGLKRSDHPPILIYQMGKVGSTSVSSSLNAAGLKNYVFDIHFLSNDLNKYRKFFIDSGIVPVPYHIELGLALRKRIIGVDHRSGQSSKIAGKESRPTKLKSWEMGCRSRFLRDRDCGRNDDQRRIIRNSFGRFKIISMVRDPIGRQISDVFQNPEIMEMDIRNPDELIDKNKAMALIQDKFSDLKTFDYVFEWFDRELKSVFGIDVFAKPFNRDSGWTIYNGENADALVLRMEDLSAVGENVISEFLNTPRKITLFESNVRSQTPEAKAYSYVKNNVKIDRKLCEKVYASQFVRHFYSDTQIEAMKCGVTLDL